MPSSPRTLASSSAWTLSDSWRASIRPRFHSFSSRAPPNRISRLSRLSARMKPPRRDPPKRKRRRAGASSVSALAVAVTDAIQGLDRVELGIDYPELLSHPFDVAVDGAVIDIDLIVVGGVHQAVAALHETGALGQGLKQQELGDGQLDRTAFPGALVAGGVHRQLAALD